jgi:hypothetical protein
MATLIGIAQAFTEALTIDETSNALDVFTS